MATADYPQESIGADPASADPAGVLRRSLIRLAARRNAQRMGRALAGALVWGVGFCALAMLAYRFFLINGEWWMLLFPLIASLLVGYRNGQLAQAGTFDAALEADRSLGLEERLSSALAFTHPDMVRRAHRVDNGSGPLARLHSILLPRMAYDTTVRSETTQLVPALVRDAARRSATLDPKQVYPARLDRTHWLLIGFCALWLGFALMPNIQLFRSPEDRKLAAALQTEGKELEAVAKEIRQKDEEKAESINKKMAKRMEKLGQKMQQGRMSKREALVQLGQLKKDLEKAAKNDNQNTSAGMQEALKALAGEKMESSAGQKMQDAAKKGDTKQAAKEMEKLADQVEKGELSPEEQKKAASDLQKAANALRKEGGQQGEQMAQQLEQAAKALQQQSQQGQQNQQGQQGNAAASNALRDLAKGMQQGGTPSGNSQGLKDMLKKIQEAEKQTGENSGKPSDAPCPECGKNHEPGGT